MPGQPFALTLTLANPTGKAADFKLAFRPKKGITLTPAETTVHAAGQFRIDDFAVFNHDLGLEMAFDAGHRIDGDRGFRLGSFCHKVAPQKRLERETPFRVSDKRNPGGLPPPGRKTA